MYTITNELEIALDIFNQTNLSPEDHSAKIMRNMRGFLLSHKNSCNIYIKFLHNVDETFLIQRKDGNIFYSGVQLNRYEGNCWLRLIEDFNNRSASLVDYCFKVDVGKKILKSKCLGKVKVEEGGA